MVACFPKTHSPLVRLTYAYACIINKHLSRDKSFPIISHVRLANSDQPAYQRSLIKDFAVCSMDSEGPKASSHGQRRL